MAKKKAYVVKWSGAGPFAQGEIFDADDERAAPWLATWEKNGSVAPATAEDVKAAGVSEEEWEMAEAQSEILDLEPAATPILTTGDTKSAEYDFQAATAPDADAAPAATEEEREAMVDANLASPSGEGESTLPQDNKKARGSSK
jgi:hypothetical protein